MGEIVFKFLFLLSNGFWFFVNISYDSVSTFLTILCQHSQSTQGPLNILLNIHHSLVGWCMYKKCAPNCRNEAIRLWHHYPWESLLILLIKVYWTIDTVGRSEKPLSWKSKNGQADYLPRHSPDVRTVFEILIRPFVSCEICLTRFTEKGINFTIPRRRHFTEKSPNFMKPRQIWPHVTPLSWISLL